MPALRASSARPATAPAGQPTGRLLSPAQLNQTWGFGTSHRACRRRRGWKSLSSLERLQARGRSSGSLLCLFVRACGRAGAQTFRGKGLMAPHLVGLCRHPSSIHALYVHGMSRKSHNSNTFLFGGVLSCRTVKASQTLVQPLKIPGTRHSASCCLFHKETTTQGGEVVSSPSGSKRELRPFPLTCSYDGVLQAQ